MGEVGSLNQVEYKRVRPIVDKVTATGHAPDPSSKEKKHRNNRKKNETKNEHQIDEYV